MIQDHYLLSWINAKSITKITGAVTTGHEQRKRTSILTKYIGCCYVNKAKKGGNWDGAHLAMGELHSLVSLRQPCTPHVALACLFIATTVPIIHLCAARLAMELGEWRMWYFWENHKGPLHLELPSWFPSASPHPSVGSTPEPSHWKGERAAAGKGGAWGDFVKLPRTLSRLTLPWPKILLSPVQPFALS